MSHFIFKSIVLSASGDEIRTSEGTLCAVEDENGDEKMMFVSDDAILATTVPETDCNKKRAESLCISPQSKTAAAASAVQASKSTDKTKWGDGDTKKLLDNYALYLPNVGPMKRFKNKKCMWEQISKDILEDLSIAQTSSQCENRYKTVLKRKMEAKKVNNTSGCSPEVVPFEDEIAKIKDIDDSLEPEVLCGVDKCIGEEKTGTKIKISQSHSSETCKKQKAGALSKILKELHEGKERSKERRHKEKLELLKSLLQED